MGQIQRMIPVLDSKPPVHRPGDPHRSNHLLVLDQSGTHRKSRPHQPVNTEIPVVGIIPEVTPVAVLHTPVIPVPGHPVVNPFPNEMTLNRRITIENPLIIRQTPGPVPHGMGVLTDNPGLARRLLPELLHLLRRGVHRTHHIHHGSLAILLVMNRPGAIQLLRPAISRLDTPPHPRFIAQRPHNDTRVILLRPDMTLDPIHVSRFPSRVRRSPVQVIDPHKTMTLQITLGENQKTHLIAELVETRVIRVM